MEANRQFQQSHSYKQKNYLRKEPIFNERSEQIAALPPTILKLKTASAAAAEHGKVFGSRLSMPLPQVTIMNSVEEVTDNTQISDHQSDEHSMARSNTQGFMKKNNEDGTESNQGSQMMKAKL